MRKYILIASLIIPGLLSAQRLGLGIIVGSPTGLSLKYNLSQRSAFAAHAGWSFIDDKGFHITGDYQHLFPMIIKTAEGTSISDLTPYIAAGGRLRAKEEDDETKIHVGIRIGGGAEYSIDRFGIFLEVVPVLDLIPETALGFEGGIGFLFYF